MTAASDEALRKGWCPGALRPMQSGDGLLVRLRLTGGRVPAALARDLAAAARRFGSGAFDLSARANLQMRGVSEETLPGLIDRLAELGVLDDDAAGEAVRNVIASPLAGLDDTAVIDIRPVVATLEARLARDKALHALPGKFGFAVDDGGMAPLGDLSVDIRFEALATPAGPAFAVVAGGRADGPVLGACRPDEVPDAAAAVARAFLALRGPHRRLAPLVAAIGARAVADAAGLGAGPYALPPRIPVAVPGDLVAGGRPVLAVAAAFGRWSADALEALAGLGETTTMAVPPTPDPSPQGGGGAAGVEHNSLRSPLPLAGRGEGWGEPPSSEARSLHLTPWRCILVPGVTARDAAPLLAAHDLIADPADPRLAVAACAGAPGCSSALGPTRELALALAPAARALSASGIGLHVSGCPKGCAHPGPAPVTLVAHGGTYDLVIGGRAGDEPARRGLDRAAVARALQDQGERA